MTPMSATRGAGSRCCERAASAPALRHSHSTFPNRKCEISQIHQSKGGVISGISNAEIAARRSEDKDLSWAQKRYLDILSRGDRDICFYCHVNLNDENRTLDHLVPKAHGGSDGVHNLVLCCKEHNHRKADTDVGAFMKMLLLERTRRIMVVNVVDSDAPLVPKFPPPKPKKAVVAVVPWDDGHDEARERITSVKRAKEVRVNDKGYPDP